MWAFCEKKLWGCLFVFHSLWLELDWMVWLLLWRGCWWLLSFDIEITVCMYVWLGQSVVGNWMVWCCRREKLTKCCKLVQNYLSVFLNRPNPCNDELRFSVCRGWLEMDGFKCFCSTRLFLWRLEEFFFCLFDFIRVHLTNSPGERKKE